jgi:hypothetical protein
MSWCRFFLQTISPSNDWPRLLDWARLDRIRVEGGLLLAKTTQSSRPLEISIDMTIDHVARHVNAPREPRSLARTTTSDVVTSKAA